MAVCESDVHSGKPPLQQATAHASTTAASYSSCIHHCNSLCIHHCLAIVVTIIMQAVHQIPA